MSITGIKISDEVINIFNEMKLKKTYMYVIYKIDLQSNSVVIDKTNDNDINAKDMIEKYNSFVSDITFSGEPRFGVIDFSYITTDNRQNNKLVFVMYNPDSAKVKLKMLYASTKESLTKQLIGIAQNIQATNLDELSYNHIIQKLN